jgi:hypothetical protein
MSNQNNKSVRVKAESLPLSMQHYSDDDALLQAECLIKFLQKATSVILRGEDAFDGDCAYGLDLVFNLLRDKLDVVSGASKVPFTSTLSDAPEWNPSAGGADE